MQTGTEILLARMKEYPEEFGTDGLAGTRWTSLIHDAKTYLPKEDVTALEDGLRQMWIDRFNERVLARLAGEDREAPEASKTAEQYNVGWTDPRAAQMTPWQAQNQATQNSMANTTMGLGQSLATYGLACGLPKGLFK